MPTRTSRTVKRLTPVDVMLQVAEAWGFRPEVPFHGKGILDFFNAYNFALREFGLAISMNGNYCFLSVNEPPPHCLTLWACSRADSARVDDEVGLRVLHGQREEMEIRWNLKQRKTTVIAPRITKESDFPWLIALLQALEAVPELKKMFLDYRWVEGRNRPDHEAFVDFITDELVEFCRPLENSDAI